MEKQLPFLMISAQIVLMNEREYSQKVDLWAEPNQNLVHCLNIQDYEEK
jgi:hypothetical protein